MSSWIPYGYFRVKKVPFSQKALRHKLRFGVRSFDPWLLPHQYSSVWTGLSGPSYSSFSLTNTELYSAQPPLRNLCDSVRVRDTRLPAGDLNHSDLASSFADDDALSYSSGSVSSYSDDDTFTRFYSEDQNQIAFSSYLLLIGYFADQSDLEMDDFSDDDSTTTETFLPQSGVEMCLFDANLPVVSERAISLCETLLFIRNYTVWDLFQTLLPLLKELPIWCMLCMYLFVSRVYNTPKDSFSPQSGVESEYGEKKVKAAKHFHGLIFSLVQECYPAVPTAHYEEFVDGFIAQNTCSQHEMECKIKSIRLKYADSDDALWSCDVERMFYKSYARHVHCVCNVQGMLACEVFDVSPEDFLARVILVEKTEQSSNLTAGFFVPVSTTDYESQSGWEQPNSWAQTKRDKIASNDDISFAEEDDKFPEEPVKQQRRQVVKEKPVYSPFKVVHDDGQAPRANHLFPNESQRTDVQLNAKSRKLWGPKPLHKSKNSSFKLDGSYKF